MLNVYIGYDTNRSIVHDVCRYSIQKRTSEKINFHKIGSSILSKKDWWKIESQNSTEFSNNRFLTPYLNNFKDLSIFMDDDFLCNCDIKELLNYYDERYSVMVVKHKNYISSKNIKMENKNQTNYDRKNWSSLMIFNNSHPDVKKLTPEYVNNSHPLNLHQFGWTGEIGEISKEYNYLVDENEYMQSDCVKFFHFTLGGPWYDDYKKCTHSELWLQEMKDFLRDR